MRVFGWIWVVLGLMGLVGIVGYGAWWHWFTVVASVVMAWSCFAEAKREREERKKIRRGT